MEKVILYCCAIFLIYTCNAMDGAIHSYSETYGTRSRGLIEKCKFTETNEAMKKIAGKNGDELVDALLDAITCVEISLNAVNEENQAMADEGDVLSGLNMLSGYCLDSLSTFFSDAKEEFKLLDQSEQKVKKVKEDLVRLGIVVD